LASFETATRVVAARNPICDGVPGLVRKYYLYGDDLTGGGVYLWKSREGAERFYSEAWKATIAQRYGAQPEILFYETPVIVDNVNEKTASAA
jgi:hypothetical protein